MAEQHWTLKILAGVHVGAEITLPDEESILGTDDACDLMLDDAGLAGRHVSLSPRPTGVRMSVLDTASPVVVDGQPVEGTVELGPYQVVSVGGLCLAVGPADQPWPAIDLPSSQAAAPPGEAAAPAESGVKEATEAQAPAGTDTERADAAVRAPRRWALAAGALVGVLIVAAGGARLLTPGEVESHHATAAETTRQIQEIASRYGAIIEVGADPRPDGRFRITGVVATEAQRSELLDGLSHAGVPAVVDIRSTEEIVESVTSILNQSLNLDANNALQVLPVAGAPGEVRVAGYVEDEACLLEAQAIIERDVRHAKGFTYEVHTKAERLSALRQRLDAAGVGGRFRIQELDDRIGLFGPVHSEDELSRLHLLAQDFNDEFDSRPSLTLSGTTSFVGESTIDLDVRAAVLGERNHIVLHDGESYSEGSKVPGDYVIKTITRQYVILEGTEHLTQDAATVETDIAYFIFES